MLTLLMQAADQVSQAADTGLSPASHATGFHPTTSQDLLYGYLAVLFILWLIARLGRQKKKDFSAEAQKVLDEKFQKGEIDRTAYEKYRQELSMRLKKD